jgi:hypothetical protein
LHDKADYADSVAIACASNQGGELADNVRLPIDESAAPRSEMRRFTK